MPDSSAQTRARAFLSMTTSLGPDKLIPTRLRAEEAISAPFLFRVEMVSKDAKIRPDDLLNTAVCLTLRGSEGVIRRFHGVVRRFHSAGPTARNHWVYSAEIVPRLWFLQQTEDCRTFEQKTAGEIIKELFQDASLVDYEFRVGQEPARREYTVQYNETDFALASRLMEEEGWFYFFEHSAEGHRLVITDGNDAFVPLKGITFKFEPAGEGSRECLTLWDGGLETAHGSVKLTDYDYTQPAKTLEASEDTTLETSRRHGDVFHWPARTADSGEVSRRARSRIQAAEAAAELREGASAFEGFCPGVKFALIEAPQDSSAATEFVIQSIVHEATDESWRATGAGAPSYSNRFRAFPASRPWREPMRTKRPNMAGLFSAIVIGPGSEEVYTDGLGRVRVRFHWDHRPTATDNQALWLRVIQPWTGNGWGWQFLPRVGTEVAVAFMECDPDRPVVVGGLYNGNQTPPFALPDRKTVSGIRTRSSPGGGRADYSELSIDDAKGQELVLLHAQKDLQVEVEHDETLTVDHCRVRKVRQDETVSIGNAQSISVGGDRAIEVKGSQSTKITSDRSAEIVEGSDTLKLGMGNRSVTLSMGTLSWKADLGAINGEAMQSIELKVGANSLKIDQSGVTISGIMLKLSGQAMLDMKSPLTSVNADGILILKGGLVMLN
jgi:type VI secretion system secreted protein VgrG